MHDRMLVVLLRPVPALMPVRIAAPPLAVRQLDRVPLSAGHHSASERRNIRHSPCRWVDLVLSHDPAVFCWRSSSRHSVTVVPNATVSGSVIGSGKLTQWATRI